MGDVHQTTKMTKMGRMTWTTNMNQMSKWCPSDVTCQLRCPSGQHSSAVGLVVGMSTMIPNMCPPYVHQDDVPSVFTNVGQEDPDAKFQVGQVSDSRVGSMETKLVSSRSSGFKQMSGKLKLPC